jgi:hypothetical protein
MDSNTNLKITLFLILIIGFIAMIGTLLSAVNSSIVESKLIVPSANPPKPTHTAK